jgi:hypothetical protein
MTKIPMKPAIDAILEKCEAMFNCIGSTDEEFIIVIRELCAIVAEQQLIIARIDRQDRARGYPTGVEWRHLVDCTKQDVATSQKRIEKLASDKPESKEGE